MPAYATKVSCKDAGVNHEGLWNVAVQSCSDTTNVWCPKRGRIHTYQSQVIETLGRQLGLLHPHELARVDQVLSGTELFLK
jgi:hypothetical protein